MRTSCSNNDSNLVCSARRIHTAYWFWHTFCTLLFCIHKVPQNHWCDCHWQGSPLVLYWKYSIFLRFYPFWSILVHSDNFLLDFFNLLQIPPPCHQCGPLTNSIPQPPLEADALSRSINEDWTMRLGIMWHTCDISCISFIAAECNCKPVIGFHRFYT